MRQYHAAIAAGEKPKNRKTCQTLVAQPLFFCQVAQPLWQPTCRGGFHQSCPWPTPFQMRQFFGTAGIRSCKSLVADLVPSHVELQLGSGVVHVPHPKSAWLGFCFFVLSFLLFPVLSLSGNELLTIGYSVSLHTANRSYRDPPGFKRCVYEWRYHPEASLLQRTCWGWRPQC